MKRIHHWVLILAVFVLSGCSREITQTQLALAPNFELPDANGNLRTLNTARGKLLLLSFSAPWCFLCQAEMDRLAYLQQYFGSDKVSVMIIASLDTPERLRRFAKSFNRLNVLIDFDSNVVRAYDVSTLPATFVIGPDGRYMAMGSKQAYRFDGLVDWGSAQQIGATQELINSLSRR